jgi:hypothetical protein
VADVNRGYSNNSTPAVGAEYVDPTSMQFMPQSANRYRTPKDVRRKSDIGAFTDLIDWLSETFICPDGLDYVDATSMQWLQVCKQMQDAEIGGVFWFSGICIRKHGFMDAPFDSSR